ncbi:MAG: helix-hairpin-helix domain-containing protein [Candidatus Electronema sp. V4]|uniref:helix-hairpin-helix domain-containing protein n=1 Tax=Candidatus Electronema sp. V4 TaxID=3454756 RepID=UPI0040558144
MAKKISEKDRYGAIVLIVFVFTVGIISKFQTLGVIILFVIAISVTAFMLIKTNKKKIKTENAIINYTKNDEENIDVVAGLEFHATLRIGTPLCVLKHHGELFKGAASRAPKYASPADGIWIQETKSWKELGIDIPEPEMARDVWSDIGTINPDNYLPFLKRFRNIVESNKATEEKIILIEQLQNHSSTFKYIFKCLQETYGDFPTCYFYMQLTELPGVGNKTALNLFKQGFRTKEQVLSASQEELTKIPGIGAKTASRIQGKKPEPPRSLPKPRPENLQEPAKKNWLAIGKKRIESKQYKEAVAALCNALETDLKNEKIYYLRAIAYSKLAERQKALEDIKTAAELGHPKAIEWLQKNPAVASCR